uniref:RING-type E3 ubiquitin transferase n=1 Tax=Zooxanthella nutricula TaxID=1333877 RepID=A0A6V0H9M9_9DINO
MWKRGHSKSGLSSELRWRWRYIQLKEGCLDWAPRSCKVEADDSPNVAARGAVDLSLNSCSVRKVVGTQTQLELTLKRGHRWKGLPDWQGSRVFLFDAAGSETTRDQWLQLIRAHIMYGKAKAEELVLRIRLDSMVRPVSMLQVRASSVCAECIFCPICMEDYDEQRAAVQTACGHVFHDTCARRWLAEEASCPSCRADLKSQSMRLRAERRCGGKSSPWPSRRATSD